VVIQPIKLVNLFRQLLVLSGDVQHEPPLFGCDHGFGVSPHVTGFPQEISTSHRPTFSLARAGSPAQTKNAIGNRPAIPS
jgi:hypothetical protein